MEKLQGPFNPSLFGQDLDVSWLEEFVCNIGNNYKFEDSYNEEVCDTTQSNNLLPSLEDKIPFLQMLQGIEPSQLTTPFIQQQSVGPKMISDRPTTLSMPEPNYFQLLLRLQHHQDNFTSNFTTPFELESCMTNNINNNDMIMDLHSNSPIKCETPLVKTPSPNNVGGGVNISAPRERKKRKRPTKVTKNKEEVETQRMTHIAVERNRRRQMNEHLNALRSLMPPSYVQRGDQASIIGGAIDYVKEMEQMLESLQAQKAMRHQPDEDENNIITPTASSTSSSSNMINNMMFVSSSTSNQVRGSSSNGDSAENRSDFAEIKVVVIQNHVNLKIKCQRRVGQLLKAIVTFEQLRLTILHLNITSLQTLVHYSFNLKIEDDCQLRTADDVVRAVHHIFN